MPGLIAGSTTGFYRRRAPRTASTRPGRNSAARIRPVLSTSLGPESSRRVAASAPDWKSPLCEHHVQGGVS